MHPWISQAVARDHQSQLVREAERHRRHADRPAKDSTSPSSWDAKLGWMLIRLGCRLVALRANPAQLASVRSA